MDTTNEDFKRLAEQRELREREEDLKAWEAERAKKKKERAEEGRKKNLRQSIGRFSAVVILFVLLWVAENYNLVHSVLCYCVSLILTTYLGWFANDIARYSKKGN